MIVVYPVNMRVSCLTYEKIVNEYQKNYELQAFLPWKNQEKLIVHKNFTAMLLEYAIMSPVRRSEDFMARKQGIRFP